MQARSLSDLPDALVDLILHIAYRHVWYDQHKGQLRLVCRRWARQILQEAALGGITVTRPFSQDISTFLINKLSCLQSLTFSVKLGTLCGLEALGALTHLSLRLGSLASVAPLGGLSSLQRLELLEGTEYGLDDMEGWQELASLAALDKVFVQYHGVPQLSWLAHCPHVSEVMLTLNDAQTPPDGLFRMSSLCKLGLFMEMPMNGVFLSPLTSLHTLMLESISMEDEMGIEIVYLTYLSNLETLILDNLTLLDLELLAQLSGLTCLSLSCCNPLWQGFDRHGAEWLAPLSKLQRLDLEESRMRDDSVAVVAQLTSLEMLNIGHNGKIRHVLPLADVKGLTWLGLSGCDGVKDSSSLPGRIQLDLDDADLNWFQAA